jgi:hypothetical protein
MLYKVKIETDIMVVADNNASAVEIAKKNAPSEVSLYGKGTAYVVNSVNEIPDDWMSIIPYSKDGAWETKKCFEIVSAGKSNKKELPKDDIEEIIKIKSDSKMSPEVNLEVKPETRPDPKPKELDWHETKSGRPMPSLRFVR